MCFFKSYFPVDVDKLTEYNQQLEKLHDKLLQIDAHLEKVENILTALLSNENIIDRLIEKV